MNITSANPSENTNGFQPLDFPEVIKELAAIKDMIRPLHQVENAAIVVSYLKDHMIRTDLTQSHRELVAILTSKNTCHFLEDLFLASRENASFRLSLENYVVDQFSK
jgi:hypothetical protein